MDKLKELQVYVKNNLPGCTVKHNKSKIFEGFSLYRGEWLICVELTPERLEEDIKIFVQGIRYAKQFKE